MSLLSIGCHLARVSLTFLKIGSFEDYFGEFINGGINLPKPTILSKFWELSASRPESQGAWQWILDLPVKLIDEHIKQLDLKDFRNYWVSLIIHHKRCQVSICLSGQFGKKDGQRNKKEESLHLVFCTRER